jgi:hypothetical protein
MRTVRQLLAALVGALAIVVAAPGPASACSCVQGSPKEYAGWADVVLVGTLRHVDEGRTEHTYTFAVDRVLAGEAAPVVAVRSAASGASCGLEGLVEGGRYVVFAERSGAADLAANLCGGTAPADAGYLAEVEGVTGPGTAPAYDSTPAVTLSGAAVQEQPGAAAPFALAAGGVFVLLTGALWLRFLRS